MKNPLILRVALFTIACCVPALEFRGNDAAFGLRILVIGCSGIFDTAIDSAEQPATPHHFMPVPAIPNSS